MGQYSSYFDKPIDIPGRGQVWPEESQSPGGTEFAEIGNMADMFEGEDIPAFDGDGQDQGSWFADAIRSKRPGHNRGDTRGVLDGNAFAATGNGVHKNQQAAFLDYMREESFYEPEKITFDDIPDDAPTEKAPSSFFANFMGGGMSKQEVDRNMNVRRAEMENRFYQQKYNNESNLTNDDIRAQWSLN